MGIKERLKEIAEELKKFPYLEHVKHNEKRIFFDVKGQGKARERNIGRLETELILFLMEKVYKPNAYSAELEIQKIPHPEGFHWRIEVFSCQNVPINEREGRVRDVYSQLLKELRNYHKNNKPHNPHNKPQQNL